MKIEELREIFSEDGLYTVRVENGAIVSHCLPDYTILIIQPSLPAGTGGALTYLNLIGTSIPHALKNRPNGSFSVTAGADARLKKPLASTTVTG